MGICASFLSRDTDVAEVANAPYSYETIITDADSPIDRSSTERTYDQLYSGVYLNGRKQKYWIQRESRHNCFAVFPRDFHISWGENSYHWTWPMCEEEGSDHVEMAELQNVSYFHVSGKFDISRLSPDVMYEIVYVVKRKRGATGWEVPISVEFTTQGVESKRNLSLLTKPLDQWTEIHIGEFQTSYAVPDGGYVSFCIAGNEGLNWKNGLTIKCVVIRPKENPSQEE